MDIKVFIRKGVVYVCAIAIAALVFMGIAVLLNALTGFQREYVPLGVAVAVAVLVAILFQPVKRWVQDSFNRYLYRHSYDYQRTVREASRRLSTILDLRSLLNYLAEVIGQTLKVEMVVVYLREHPQQAFTAKLAQQFARWEREPSPPTLAATSALVAFLEGEKRTLIVDEGLSAPQLQHLIAAVQELQSLGGEMALPVVQDKIVSGIVVVGPKLSGDPYFPDDIDLLATLVSQAGIAIKNAQLYGEIVLANEYIRNTLANIESGVVAVDAEGEVTLFNPAADRMIGQWAGALRGGSASALPPALAHSLIATLQDGLPQLHVESMIPQPSGRPTPIVLNTSPLTDDEGRVLGAVVVFSDLTKLKELEGEKRRAERLAAWSALAAGIAHEIKNPLVAIKTFAELLPERYTDVDFRENFSNVAIKEIERIDALVGRLRGLGAPATQAFHPVDLRQPIEETLALLAGQLEQKQITVTKEYADALPAISGDPSQLKQLLLNLFMNSLDAMEPGGELTIRLATRSGYGQDTLHVEVRDTGKGIPEELLDKVFNPFVTTKHRDGGLGLAICRGITDSHHATIRAENNRDGHGTTLIVEFPAAAESPVPVHS
jgi:PAS domain S-box-containing protein